MVALKPKDKARPPIARPVSLPSHTISSEFVANIPVNGSSLHGSDFGFTDDRKQLTASEHQQPTNWSVLSSEAMDISD